MATTPSVSAPGIGWAALLDDDMLASGLKLPTATPLGLAYQAAAMAGWSSAAMLPALRNVPTLILMGERDGVVPADRKSVVWGKECGSTCRVRWSPYH